MRLLPHTLDVPGPAVFHAVATQFSMHLFTTYINSCCRLCPQMTHGSHSLGQGSWDSGQTPSAVPIVKHCHSRDKPQSARAERAVVVALAGVDARFLHDLHQH